MTIFLTFFRLGCTSFGGPVAHLAYFRDEFVERKKWISEKTYADLISFCQFLPGPASSQVVLSLGFYSRGIIGAFAAWLGFCLPSVIILILFAHGMSAIHDTLAMQIIDGLKVVAVAVVAKAVWQMATKLCEGKLLVSIMAICCITTLLFPQAYVQFILIFIVGLFGSIFINTNVYEKEDIQLLSPMNKKWAIFIFCIFCLLLLMGGLYSNALQPLWQSTFNAFFKSGALVFGGGHVILPLLKSELVPQNMISLDLFMAGYGASQAVPGPLFTFSAYLGAFIPIFSNIWLSAFWCLFAIYLPSFLMILSGLPFWDSLRSNLHVKSALKAINAGVVGLLLAALYDPVWIGAIHSSSDFSLALLSFVMLMFWNVPAWLVVSLGGLFYLLF